MGEIKKTKNSSPEFTAKSGNNFIERLGEENWEQIKTIINILHQPVLILDKYKKLVLANDIFYSTFQHEPQNSEGKIIYSLGNSQWNIPSLHKLLEEILPHNHFFKGYEIAHTFPFVGRKVMILNVREINCINAEGLASEPLTFIAIEDITDMMVVAESLADHANNVNYRFNKEAQKLESYIGKLEKEVNVLKHRL